MTKLPLDTEVSFRSRKLRVVTKPGEAQPYIEEFVKNAMGDFVWVPNDDLHGEDLRRVLCSTIRKLQERLYAVPKKVVHDGI